MHANLKLALLSAGALLLAASAADAAPIGTIAGHGATAGQPLVQVDYRQCWWRSGKKYCRWVSEDDEEAPRAYRYRDYPIDVGSRRPEEFATGSNEWWRAMDRQGRGGFGRP